MSLNARDKPLVWLHGEVKTPPFGPAGRRKAGEHLRALQRGDRLEMPHSRPMPAIGARCHELRIVDAGVSWRIVYRLDPDAIVILDVFRKSTRRTPDQVVHECRRRLKSYDAAARGGGS